MKRIIATFLCLLLLLSVLTGCSKKYRTVKDIQESGELLMLTNAGFEPYEYIAGGQVVGADVDLAQMIADELGVSLRIIDMDFDLLVDALSSGKGDIIAAGMTANEERAKSVDFSVEYVNNTLKIIVAADSDIKTPEDLVGKRIAVQEGTTSDMYVSDNIDVAELLRFKDAVVAGTSVSTGKADACVVDLKPAEGIVANSDGALITLPDNLTEETFSMAVAKGNTELREIVDKVLGPAYADGTVDEIVQKHMDLTTQN